MFESIERYFEKSREERVGHLNLNEACIEIGGKNSTEYRGLLAHYLQTEIPTSKKVVCAHACNNHKCSNPRHLYWATYSENTRDAYNAGATNLWQRTVEKHGLEKARLLFSERGTKGGKEGGKKTAQLNSLTQEEIKNWKEIFEKVDTTKIGWLSLVQKQTNCSHTWIRKVADKYFKDLTFYKRTSK